MGGLFKPKPPKIVQPEPEELPEPPPPTPLPDEEAIERERRRVARQAQAQSGARTTRLAPRTAQAGQEFSRRTLG